MKAAFLPRCDGATLNHYARRSSAFPAAIIVLFFAAAINDARSQNYREWTGGTGTNWSDFGVWNNGGYTSNAQLEWKGGGNSTSWNNFGTVNQWRFYFSGSTAYTLGGDSVNFFDVSTQNAGILSDSSALQTINMNVSFRDEGARTAFITTRGAGGITFGGGVEVTNSVTVLGIGGTNSASIISFNGAISGNKPIVVGTNSFAGNTTDTGETRVVFAGNNTYTGATTVERGALTITHANALGATNGGTTVSANAVLRLSGGITVSEEALTLSGGGFAGSGALLSISGSNNYNGLITLSANPTYIGASTNAILKVSAINAGANEFWVVGDGTTILGSGATNSGTNSAFVKTNTGTAILSASNAWSGNEFIRQGTVILNHNNGFGAAGTTHLGALGGSTATATLQLGSGIINSNAIFVESNGSGTRTLSYQEATGSATQLGNITLDTNSLAFNVASGGTLRFGGTVSLNTGINHENRLALDGGGTLIVTNSGTAPSSDRYQVRVGNGTLIIGEGALITRTGVAGLGHGYDLGVNLTNGIVDAASAILASNQVTVASSIYVSTTNSKTRTLGISGAGTATFSGNVGLRNAGLTVSADNAGGLAKFTGNITNFAGTTPNTLTKTGSGTVTLSGDNTYAGGTTISGGTLQFAKTTAMSSTGTVAVGTGTTLAVNVGGTGEFTTGASGSGTLGGLLGGTGGQGAGVTYTGDVTLGIDTSNAGAAQTYSSAIADVTGSSSLGIVKLGSGTLTFDQGSANTYTGLTTVRGGTLNLDKTPGVNAIAGAVRVESTAVLLLSKSDQVASDAGDTVTLSGGTIRRVAGVSEVFGDLNLTAASFLDFGSGATGTIGFGTYTPSALTALDIANFTQGNTLTFRSNLTSTIETSAFTFSGSGGLGSYSWDSGTSTFTITAIPEPSTYVAAAGLLAMFLWPVRRRMIKDLQSILGLRPTGRERIEAYRRA